MYFISNYIGLLLIAYSIKASGKFDIKDDRKGWKKTYDFYHTYQDLT